MSPQSRRRWSLLGVLVAASAFGAAWGTDHRPAQAILFGIAAVVYLGVLVVPNMLRASAAAASGARMRRPGAKQWALLAGCLAVIVVPGWLDDDDRSLAVAALAIAIGSILLIWLSYRLTPRPGRRVND